MARTSTNALAARYAASMGWLYETVQTWRGTVRHDLFGIADGLLLRPGLRPTLVQNCSYGTLKAHRDNINATGLLERLDAAGASVILWEWRRPKLKRGGKNKSRMWVMRSQGYTSNGGWWDESAWSEPMDLYPRKS